MGYSKLTRTLKSIQGSRKDFESILDKLLKQHIQLFSRPGTSPFPAIPWKQNSPTSKEALKAITRGKVFLPLAYLQAYVDPLLEHLPTFLTRCPDRYYEPLLGAIYNHADTSLQYPLRQFSAVLSNFYRSFLDARRRANVDFPSVAQLPPLAVFLSREPEEGIFSGEFGPFSIPVNQIRSLFGGTVGVIVLPSTYAFHPLLWSVLAHEVGGHDMLHADKTLLPEMEDLAKQCFDSGPGQYLLKSQKLKHGQKELIGQLWSYWIEEAAADVLAVLNVGPSYGFSLAIFMGLLSRHITEYLNRLHIPYQPPSLIRLSSGTPKVTDPEAVQTGSNPNRADVDHHPVDILRLYVTLGAIEGLNAYSPDLIKQYATTLEQLIEICSEGGGDSIGVHGWLPVQGEKWRRIDEELDFGVMRDSARLMGRLIGNTKFQAFNNHSFQDLETWDDHDEETAESIWTILAQNQQEGVRDMGDDAHLLAGATLAFLEKHGWYKSISNRLGQALENSFDRDAYWGVLGAEPAVSWSPDPYNKKILNFIQKKKAEVTRKKKPVQKIRSRK
ncbi:MAG: hypothetical protein KC590_09525 [Nitrospira sp.]|nr:hypothetical protein [Nitrospira sp.]